jgi:DNA-binding response OmpR family regulator
MDRSTDDQQRRSRRVEAAFRVRYRSIEELALALDHDLARRSLFMCTQRELAIDTIIRVYLELPDGGATVPVLARVVFVRRENEATQSGKPAGIGVELLDLSVEHLDGFRRFVADHRVSPATKRERHKLDIVVADDDASFRDWVAGVLISRGDRVRPAGDGIEALQACLSEPPDLLLSDVQMPRMDGWQLLRILRARTSLVQVPIVLLTTLTDDEARLEGYRLGVDDYIGKPVLDHELGTRIDLVVTRSRELSTHQRPALRGDLEHVALVSLLSFLSVERKSGVLEVLGDSRARIFMRAGQLLRADINDVPASGVDDPLLRALLTWSRGRFEFVPQNVVCEDELHASISALLLERKGRGDERH